MKAAVDSSESQAAARVAGAAVPGQEFVEALGGMIGQAGEDVGQPGARVDIVELGGRPSLFASS